MSEKIKEDKGKKELKTKKNNKVENKNVEKEKEKDKTNRTKKSDIELKENEKEKYKKDNESKNKKENDKETEITENKELKVAKSKKENNVLTVKQQKQIEIIEKQIKEQEKLSKEKISKVYKNIFKNICFSITILLYFILIVCGYNLINQKTFVILLKAISMLLISATIIVFEIAYKKDSGKITVSGIELLIVSICTLFSVRAYIIYNAKFESLLVSFSLLFAIYYIGKSIKEYIKEKKKVKKEVSDINNIEQEEKR